VDEVRGFGQVDLLAQHAYVLDGGSQCFVWQARGRARARARLSFRVR